MRYLHYFETEQEFEDQYEGSGYTEPWVSYTMETSAVTFNKGGGHDYSQDYFTFEILTGGNISWSYYDDYEGEYTDATKTIYYSKNNGEWTAMPRTLLVAEGDIIRFKGDNDGYGEDYNYNSFANSTAVFNAKGNIMSLINSNNFASLTALAADYTFCQLMAGCQVINASNLVLPATTLAEKCYAWMFLGCTGLTQAPVLSATTLASNCYSTMFYGCTSLTSSPALPATALTIGCYEYMFNDCTSLTSAPVLPATILTYGCYNGMFQGCTNLNYIKAMFTTTPSTTYTYNWVSGVAASGTFVKNASATWTTTGVNGIPTNWTVETAAS